MSGPATGEPDASEPDAPEPAAPRRRAPWVAPAAVGAAALASCLLVHTLNPVEESNPPICPFKLITGGVDCPGCGATRAANALMRGHLGAAADHNLLFVVLAPVFVVAWALWMLRALGVDVPPLPRPRRWLPVLLVLVGVFWALRVLPWAPVAWLASGRA